MIVSGAVTAPAQITLTSNDVPGSPGTTMNYSTTGSNPITVNLGASGPNQTWNFSSVNLPQGLQINWVSPSSTPFSSQFPTANRCSEVDQGTFKSYGFDLLTSTGFTIQGSGLTVSDTIYSVQIYTRTSPTFVFPATYGSQWTAVFEVPNSPTISVVDSIIAQIDAWGTLTDQSGTYPCLRCKQHYFIFTYQNGNLIATSTLWIYSWNVPVRGAEISISSSSNESNPNFTTGYFTRLTQILAVQPLPEPQILPTLMELNPAFPNPFNSQTELTFSLPRSGDVLLMIYDASGRRVRDLANSHYASGAYQVFFDGTGLSSGSYFARLVSDGSQITQRITLLK
jgi:hypothetical protein